MDRVPFAFCSSVVATLGASSLVTNQFFSKLWQKAAEEDARSRVSSYLQIAFMDGVWSYNIILFGAVRQYDYVTFPKLKELDRRHLHVVRIYMNCISFSNQSSFDEIQDIVKYTYSCVDLAQFAVTGTKTWPNDALLKLLTIYQMTTFSRISITNSSNTAVEYLLAHLKTCQLAIAEADRSNAVQVAIEDYALHKPCERLECNGGPEFSMEFFAQLFDKPITQRERFFLKFSFAEVDLKEFRKHLRTNSNAIPWKRRDGVRVEVSTVRGMHNYVIIMWY